MHFIAIMITILGLALFCISAQLHVVKATASPKSMGGTILMAKWFSQCMGKCTFISMIKDYFHAICAASWNLEISDASLGFYEWKQLFTKLQ